MARYCIPRFPESKYFQAFNKKHNRPSFCYLKVYPFASSECPPHRPTSSQLPEPGCCLSARSHWSHSGSASRWRCAAPGTQTGPWDTCLEGQRKQKTKCTLWKGGEFTYLESTYCTSKRNNVHWRDFMFDCTPSDCCGSEPALSYATSTLAPRIPFEHSLKWGERATEEEGDSYQQTPWAWQV